MKNKKNKFSISLSILIIYFLITASSPNTFKAKALLEEKNNQFKIDSFDRSTWKWNTTEVVSSESYSSSHVPSLAVDTLGNVHVAWMDESVYLAGSGADEDIFYKRWDASSSSWTTIELVSTESTDFSWGPSLAVDIFGNVHIAWHDATDYAGAGTDQDIFYKYWDASSSSWTTTELVSTESTDRSRFPSLAVDIFGNVHIAWYDAEFDWDIFYKRWNASSSSWTTTELVSTESTAFSRFPSLAVDIFGNVHIAWSDDTDYAGSGTDNDIFYKRWDATTSTWITTEVVSTQSADNSDSPSLAVDSLGNVHIAWVDYTDYAGSGTDNDIFYKRWDATTSTWITTEVVSTESVDWSTNPSLAVDSAGDVHITWDDETDYAGAGEDNDIFYKRWDATTSTWTITEVVSTESIANYPHTSDSYHPSLAVDTLGTVHIAWEDFTDYGDLGPGSDIFYKLFAGPPAAPELASISPNPTENDIVNLDWNNVFRADTYYVYRSTSNISTVEGLVPITTVSSSDYIDTLPSEGVYYYVVVAENFAGNSSHSNCQDIEYKIVTTTKTKIDSLWIFGTFALLFVVIRTRKKNSKLN